MDLSVIRKEIFIQTKMEKLEFWVTRNEIRPINKKVEGHGEYDSTKDQTSGSIIYRISNILQGHVRYIIAFSVTPNFNY